MDQANLSSRERLILRMRFDEKLTLVQIGQKLGLSTKRIHEIEIEALLKARSKDG